MKSRIRPPLNLSSSEMRGRKSKLRPLFDEDTAPEIEGEDDLAIPSTDDQDDDALFETPEPVSAPPHEPTPEAVASETPAAEIPVSEISAAETPEAVPAPVADILDMPLDHAADHTPDPKAVAADFLDIPPVAPPVKPPPRAENTAPLTPHRPAEPATAPVSPVRVTPEGIMKLSGGSGGPFWGGVTVISLGWALCLTAFVLGAETQIAAFTLQPFRIVILGALALFPIGLIVATAFALRHAAALSREARRTAALADAMVAPAAIAATQTTALVDSLRQQVEQAVRAVRVAHNDLNELSHRLKTETESVLNAAEMARQSTQTITGALSVERQAVIEMGAQLDVQARDVIDAVDRQARMVADASDLAQTQLREAEAALAARAADLASVAADTQSTARTVAEDLDRQTLRLETAGAGVADQIRSVEEGLGQQRAGLVSAALSLRADQEDFAVHLENQRAQLSEALTVARAATVELGESSSRGVDILRDLVLHAQDQFRQVLNGAENERTAFETRIHSTLSNISVMAADARDEMISETRHALEQLNIASEDARRAAADAAQTAQVRVDRLNESLFEAGKKADEAFDARFSSARRLIEDSAALIDEAGLTAAERLDTAFSHARDGIKQVEMALSDITARADELPLQAKSRLEEIRRAVEDGLLAMTEAARKAALETESVDQAFQERVKRNYDMLTEAVRLMGVISAQPLPTPPPAPNPYVERFERPRESLSSRSAAPEARPATTRPERTERPRRGLDPLEAPLDAPRPLASTASAPQPGRSAARPQSGLSWRDLLNGMDGREASNREAPIREPARKPEPAPAPVPVEDATPDNLDDLMIAEVASMGVDAQTLLNRSRLEEIIAAIVADDNEGARLVLRRIAPAAIRRLSRRLTTDATLRDQAQDFVTFYDRQINIALLTRDPRSALGEILGTPTGRTYLLFDAAISDLI
ncbi:tipN [Asticcacaulis sp. AND118]|uniref:tipN n=1 Tax=Asticcacaulis sp. AND118 TaxID=2840468 RepID=UPI001CFFCE2A|nr:tipN [Asticcacaulis sp. AND118]UDF04213.1 tipN [Asticcacaulis sp. AND118]